MKHANRFYLFKFYSCVDRVSQEVFKTDQHMAIPLSSIRGRCAVINVKDYFRYKPEGFDDKDVYVCESRYSSKARLFKKIKVSACV